MGKKSSLMNEETPYHANNSDNLDGNFELIIWERILEKLNEKSNPQVFFWFSSLKLISQDSKSITLEAKSNFDKDWIENHYIDFINDTILEIYNRDCEIKVISTQEMSNTDTSKTNIKKVNSNRATALSGYINPAYSFNSFIVGSSNQFAHAASFAAAQKPGKAYNPLFIYGGVGLGKTHLINAIGNHILKNNEESPRVCCISAENFTNQVINGIRTNKMEDFRNRYRFGCDVLLIDDIQFIAGKESTQEEFFHTFNTLYESKKQIVLTSDKSPHEMSYLEERLRSRFEWGLIADIQPPEIETRIAILTQKAEADGVEFPGEVAMFLAQYTNSNVRELEGVLNNLVAYSKLMNTTITIDLAKQVLKTLIKKQESRVITVEFILKEVAVYFDLKLSDLKSNKKQKSIATPRQIAMYLSRKYTVASYPDIGEKFGGKDHSTVIHAFKKIEGILGKDIALTNSINAISKKIDSTRG
ncbi:MAG: chromosomal replication initiator protein DnaA [Thermodesulfobacteriota bacterium]